MMQHLLSALLGSTLAAGLAFSAAQAADLPRRAAPPVYAPVPAFTWTGFYIGANAGYGFGNDNGNDFSTALLGNNLFVPAAPAGTLTAVTVTSATTSFVGSDSTSRNGFVGGAQIGYNYQFTPGSGFVLGVEADAQYAGFGRKDDGVSTLFGTGYLTAAPVADGVAGLGILAPVAGAAGNVALFNNAFGSGASSRTIDWFATVRGRVGYAIDRLLVYGTAGVAFTDNGGSTCSSCSVFGFTSGAAVPSTFFASTAAATAGALVAPTAFAVSNSGSNVGYVVGGGLEYAITNNLSAKLEGLYVNFDNGGRSTTAGGAVVGVSNTGAPVTAAAVFGSNNRRDDFGVVRLGVNYKFSAF